MDKPLPAYKGGNHYVFVCYAHDDEKIVYPEIRWLQNDGAHIWYDEGISAGMIWRAEIAEAIQSASIFLYYISKASLVSEHCNREVDYALDKGIKILPVYLEDVNLNAELDLALNRVQALHRSRDTNYQQHLLEGLRQPGGIGKGMSAMDDVVASAPYPGRSTPANLARRIGISIFILTVVAVFAVWIIPEDQSGDTLAGKAPSRAVDASEANSIRNVLENPMVAVLPFTNATDDPANDYVSIGVMDEIILGLQQFRSFPVVSRNVTIAFKARSEPVYAIARDLDADYILDGSLRRSGDHFRIVATLTHDDGTQVWVRGFDLEPDMSGVFPIVDELAATVAAALQNSEIKRITSSVRSPINAWEHYVKGLAIILDWQPELHAEGVLHIERALEIAPNMAEAWWGLGEFEGIRFMNEPPTDRRDAIAAVETVIGHFRKAHELSPFHAGTCGCLGIWLTAIGRDKEARVVFEQSLEANPLSGTLRVDYARFLAWEGRYPEAIEMAEISTRLGTDARDKALAATTQAVALLATDQPDAARAAVHRALFIKRLEILSTPITIPLLYVLGDRDGATVLFREFNELFPTYSPSNLGSQVDFKPIDGIIARRSNESAGLPEDVGGIFRVLAATASKPE